jgi:hypothetical protein
MTTLPYDEGWKVLIDGIEVEYTKALNAVIAFNIEDAGEHTVEFKYAPKTFTLGLTISIMSACLFILIMVFEKPLSIVWQRASEGIDSYLSKKKSEIEDESAEPDEAETSEITDDQPTPEIPEEGSVE